MKSEHVPIKLADLIGHPVSVQNIAHSEMIDGKFQFYVNGILEGPVDDDPNYLLRIKECYNGSSTISFNDRHIAVDGICRQPSGRIKITLR